MPREMREVEHYRDGQVVQVERQVMIEAKIIEVNLNDSQRAGVNWGAFRQALNSRLSVGTVTPGTSLSVQGESAAAACKSADPGASLSGAARWVAGCLAWPSRPATSPRCSTSETRGGVQVLSSPRIATLNNQKAVLKMGTDDFLRHQHLHHHHQHRQQLGDLADDHGAAVLQRHLAGRDAADR